MTASRAAYRRRRNYVLYKGGSTSPYPAGPTRDHIAALLRIGWTYAGLSYVTRGALSDQAIRFISKDLQATVHIKTARIIAALPYTLAVPPHVPDVALVPAEGAVRRARALLALGWRNEDLGSLRGIAYGCRAHSTAANWRLADDTFRRLCMTPGPRFKRLVPNRYPPPLAWDNIDDPDERPKVAPGPHTSSVDHAVVARIMRGERVPCNHAERAEVLRRWERTGRLWVELERSAGWNVAREKRRGAA